MADRVPIPAGWCTPTELTHILRQRDIVSSLQAQHIYNWIKKPGGDFPYKIHEDGRKIVPIDDSVAWYVRYLQEKAEKESLKAVAAARRAEKAAAAANIETSTAPDIESEDEWRDWN